MGKKDAASDHPRKSISHRRRGKGLLHKKESAKEFAVRTKIKYASCMDPLLEGDQLKEGELSELCCKNTHESITNFESMTPEAIDQHLYDLFGHLEGYKSHEYMRKWLGFFSIVHRQAILSKADRYMELKKLSIEDWALSIKQNRCGDILSLFTLCALTSRHAMVHLRNGNLWTTVDTPESYDHDALLSICDIHLASTHATHRTDTRSACGPGAATGTTSSANENTNLRTTPTPPTDSTTTTRTVGTIKSDPDTLDELLMTPYLTQVSTPLNINKAAALSLIRSSYVRLRKLSDADIQLWSIADTPNKQNASSKHQKVSSLEPKRAAIPSASRQTRNELPLSKTSSNKSSSKWIRVSKKRKSCSTKSMSPNQGSRTTRTQKIRKGMKSPTFKITVHGLKCYKHRYSYKCMVNPCNRQFATMRDWN